MEVKSGHPCLLKTPIVAYLTQSESQSASGPFPPCCFPAYVLFLFYSAPATPAFFKLLMAGNFTSEALKVLPWRNSLHADICRIRYLTCFKSLLKSCLYNEAFRPSCLIIKHITHFDFYLSSTTSDPSQLSPY